MHCRYQLCLHLTKSKVTKPALNKVTLGVQNKAAVNAEFELAVAVALGQSLAKEWGNRPANHATPTMLAQAAKDLAKHAAIQCKVHGPRDVESWVWAPSWPWPRAPKNLCS